MTTDTSERGLERLICIALCGHPCDGTTQTGITHTSSRPRIMPAGSGATHMTIIGSTVWTWRSSRPSCAKPSRI